MVISPIDNSSTHRHLVMYVCFHFRQNWPAYDITTCHHMTKCWDKCLAGHSDLVIHIRWLAERHAECFASHSDLVIHIRWLAKRHTECLARLASNLHISNSSFVFRILLFVSTQFNFVTLLFLFDLLCNVNTASYQNWCYRLLESAIVHRIFGNEPYRHLCCQFIINMTGSADSNVASIGSELRTYSLAIQSSHVY